MRRVFFQRCSSFGSATPRYFSNFGPQFFKTNSDWVTISLRPGRNESTRFLYRGPPSGRWPWRVQLAADVDEWRRHQHSDTHPITILTCNNFEQKAASWPAYISSAFPRFHDMYADAGAGASYGYLDDANGATFTNTLRCALTNNSAFVHSRHMERFWRRHRNRANP